jgi:hypothetical protein
MARQIESTNTYKDVLLKLIPSEIVAAYMVIDGLVPGDKPYAKWVATGASMFLLILTPIYLNKLYKVHKWLQILFTTGSFVVWVYWMGGPFKYWGIHVPPIASIILVLWTLLIPLANLPSEFNEGQIVKIGTKKPDIVSRSVGAVIWDKEMDKYLGKIARVEKVDDRKRIVKLNIDNGQHSWAFEWIRSANTSEGESDDSENI